MSTYCTSNLLFYFYHMIKKTRWPLLVPGDVMALNVSTHWAKLLSNRRHINYLFGPLILWSYEWTKTFNERLLLFRWNFLEHVNGGVVDFMGFKCQGWPIRINDNAHEESFSDYYNCYGDEDLIRMICTESMMGCNVNVLQDSLIHYRRLLFSVMSMMELSEVPSWSLVHIRRWKVWVWGVGSCWISPQGTIVTAMTSLAWAVIRWTYEENWLLFSWFNGK